jgi:hypothetical protein
VLPSSSSEGKGQCHQDLKVSISGCYPKMIDLFHGKAHGKAYKNVKMDDMIWGYPILGNTQINLILSLV